MSFRLGDIALVRSLSEGVSALAGKGIPVNSNPPQYFYSKLGDLKLELLSLAAQDARTRAKLLVSGGGAKLGKVLSASQGVFQITPPLSSETSDYGVYNTSSPEKLVTCVVTVQFAAE